MVRRARIHAPRGESHPAELSTPPRRVVWVSFAPLEKTANGFTSNIASVRYRLTIPAQALAKLGWSSKPTHVHLQANRRTLLARFAEADIVVLGKPVAASPERYPALSEHVLSLAGSLRSRNVRLVADFCDDHFAYPVLGPLYRGLANAADAVVASTPALAEVLKGETGAPVTVITDPVEGVRGAPRVPGHGASAPVSLLWFGHPTNIDTLRFGVPQLDAGKTAFSLTLATAEGPAEELAAQLAEAWRGTGKTCRFRGWTRRAVFEELEACDAVMIPSNPHDPHNMVKSPNRFTESLWAGRFVLAHPLPAYQELADYGWVGEDLSEGLRWLAAHPAEARERILRGQEAIAGRFSPQAVAESWKAVILNTLERG